MSDAQASLKLQTAHACFGGAQRFYEHFSSQIGLAMKFSVFLPPKAVEGEKVPALLYLAGLTCTEETFMTKAGAQRLAASLNVALVTCDTSPRGAGLSGESESWDFGVGAGFYLDAAAKPWALHWRMESYILEDLLPLLGAKLPIDLQRLGIFGHSMGGHGALTLALRHPGVFKSVSAFAPIANPMNCPWGQKAFTGYLGDNQAEWAQHDATALMAAQKQAPYPAGILVDQGLADKFLLEKQLLPEAFEAACAQVGQPLTLRRHGGYDHGYYFIQSFVDEHLRFHAGQL
ncbi:S-formylglutathione hydrolase [Comamonas piscis]|uniref:S-formylglutathione hydrolase n=1 Tax=Comamonas piscis TaxID=1562974 RepID=A0A7G5EMI1_9BURK|nr:S-formylglutathione hydrolase [Comamonas piscis]QMV75206.1 S-formylglutathione hydrolase [Comamonas piscis]WSO33697.1 S-formylglutathione hydrolase [Comamonas piscis]